MGYPTKLLSEDEVIKFEMRPHWRALILPVLTLIVDVFLLVLLYMWSLSLGDTWSWLRWVIIALAVIILIWRVIIPFMKWFSTQYVFTDRRVIVRSGVIAKHGRDMPLSKVNNVTFDISVFGRMLNYGELHVQSAGENAGLDIVDVPDVEQIQRDVYRLHEEDDARRRSSGGVLPTDGS